MRNFNWRERGEGEAKHRLNACELSATASERVGAVCGGPFLRIYFAFSPESLLYCCVFRTDSE